MKTPQRYDKEIESLVDALKKSQDKHTQKVKSQRYACVLFCRRERIVEFTNQTVELRTTYYLCSSIFHDGRAYNFYDIKLTEDVTDAQMFTAEEAVALCRVLPFEMDIRWCADYRTRCPVCDSLCDYKSGKDHDLDYTCKKNPEHKVPSFTLFSTKKEATNGK